MNSDLLKRLGDDLFRPACGGPPSPEGEGFWGKNALPDTLPLQGKVLVAAANQNHGADQPPNRKAYSSSTGTSLKLATSNRPLSVIFIWGMTGSAMKHSTMKGSMLLGMPSAWAAT